MKEINVFTVNQTSSVKSLINNLSRYDSDAKVVIEDGKIEIYQDAFRTSKDGYDPEVTDIADSVCVPLDGQSYGFDTKDPNNIKYRSINTHRHSESIKDTIDLYNFGSFDDDMNRYDNDYIEYLTSTTAEIVKLANELRESTLFYQDVKNVRTGIEMARIIDKNK